MHVPKNRENAEHLIKAAVLIAGALLQKHRPLAEEFLFNEIFAALRCVISRESVPSQVAAPMNKENEDEDEDGGDGLGKVVYDEQQLATCVDDVHSLLLGNAGIPEMLSLVTTGMTGYHTMSLKSSLWIVVPALFRLYCYTQRSPSSMKNIITSTLQTYFRMSGDTAGGVMKSLVLHPEVDPSGDECGADFGPGESGGVVVRIGSTRLQAIERLILTHIISSRRRDAAWEARCLVQMLKDISYPQLYGNFYVDMLKEFVALRRTQVIKEAESGEVAAPVDER
jgi:hypothetical protein